MEKHEELIEAMTAFNAKVDELAECAEAIARGYEKIGNDVYTSFVRNFASRIAENKLVIPMR